MVDTEVARDAGLSLPVDAGDPVGTLTATSAGRTLGEVTLVTSERVEERRRAEADGGGSLWEQMWSSLSRFYGRVYEVLGG
jgi:hypothetical protein